MPRTLILIRGLPGSGKSTLAKRLCRMGGGFHVEADMYFTDGIDENYTFDPARLPDAHEWCRKVTETGMQLGEQTVIVSNTFTLYKEMEPYRNLAIQYDYQIQEIICSADFGSVHGVPAATMEKMAKRFQYP